MSEPLEYLQLRKFHLPVGRRIVTAFIEQEPFQKGRLRAATASSDFRQALAEAMERSRVKFYRADVAIKFMFFSGSPNAPHHHRLIKNYVDLIDEVLLKDDRQVRIIESCHVSRPAPTGIGRRPVIEVTIMPFRLYREKHRILWQYDDDWDEERFPELDSSLWDALVERATSEERRVAYTAARERERERRVLTSLGKYDNPIVSEIFDEVGFGLPRFPDPRELVFPLPLKECAKTIASFRQSTSVNQLAHQISVDLNIEIAKFPDKDIDNLYIDIIRELRAALISSPIGDIRVYRIETTDGTPEARVKLLQAHAVMSYLHNVDKAVERTLDTLKRKW